MHTVSFTSTIHPKPSILPLQRYKMGNSGFQQARKLPVAPHPPPRDQEFGLTQRQTEVLAMMLRGFSNKRIALALAVSESTIKEHITSILGKLGVTNRIEAITLLQGRRFTL